MKKFLMVVSTFILTIVPNVMALAADSPNAVNDILNNQRYEGAIESIQSVTAIVDTGFTMFITFVAFFIISAAMLRNVLAGAYCAYPKFWDKVDAAHKEVAETGWVSRIKGLTTEWQNINAGSFGKAMLRILPNIKMLTDFEEEAIEAKSYFIKAIPQMIGVVIIGVFLYNGYYRDTAAVVSNFGAELFSRVILSADPISIYDRITGATGRPEFSSSSDKTDAGELTYKISSSAYSKVISTYNDIKGSANKSSLALALENWVKTEVEACGEYASNHANWKYSYDVTMTVGPTSQTTGEHANADGTKCTWVFNSLAISDLNLDTTKQVGVDWYLNVTINFQKRAAVSLNASFNDLVWTIQGRASSDHFTIDISGDYSKYIKIYNGAKIGGNTAKWTDSSKTTIKIDGIKKGGTYDCSGISYVDTNGVEHHIAQITVKTGDNKDGGSVTSKSAGVTVNVGEPLKKSNSKEE